MDHTMSLAMLDRLLAERQQTLDFIAQTVQGAEDQTRDLSKSEQETLQRSKARISELDEQIAPLQEFAELQARSAQVGEHFRTPAVEARQAGGARVEPREYAYRSAGEFLADTNRAMRLQDQAAIARLESNGVVVDGRNVTRAIAHQTTAETPGLLPVTITGALLNDLDADRPMMSSLGVKDLGGIPGTQFKRPIVTQHVAVGKQAAEKTEVPSQQFKVSSIDFNKETYGGALNVSRQDIDWTSPAVWDALLADFLAVYAAETDKVVAQDFAARVTQETELTTAAGATPTLNELVSALYQAAAKTYSAGGKKLPNALWMSLDQWAVYGAAIDQAKVSTPGTGGGSSSPSTFEGNILTLPRYVIPDLPEGTVIVGRKEGYEVYEDRIGFLSAIEPRLLGVELAYGGYLAKGMLRPNAFAKIVNKA